MGYLTPTEEQMRGFSEHPHSGTIWMWNLLPYRPPTERERRDQRGGI